MLMRQLANTLEKERGATSKTSYIAFRMRIELKTASDFSRRNPNKAVGEIKWSGLTRLETDNNWANTCEEKKEMKMKGRRFTDLTDFCEKKLQHPSLSCGGGVQGIPCQVT